MAYRLKFLRGMLLRLALRRRLAALVGLALLLPSLVLTWRDYSWESGMTDGLRLILSATGAALIFTAISGRQPDWIDPQDHEA